MPQTTKQLRKQRQEFLLTFFDHASDYEEKEINGFWLVKHWNGNNNTHEVAIYKPLDFIKYRSYIIKSRLKTS
jgi:hypothetical protein